MLMRQFSLGDPMQASSASTSIKTLLLFVLSPCMPGMLLTLPSSLTVFENNQESIGKLLSIAESMPPLQLSPREGSEKPLPPMLASLLVFMI
jgi:hypothetical protein